MFKLKQRAFTLIELLVVIAIIGILATLAVVALQQVRSSARDSKRVADIKQVHTALELFFNDHNRYPTVEEWNNWQIKSFSTNETFMHLKPSAPTPADGSCLSASNTYVYSPIDNNSSYILSFCLGRQVVDLPAGQLCSTPGGILPCNTTEDIGGGEPLDPFSGTSGTFTDTRDNQNYSWVKIGDQIWMAENLKYLPVVHSNTEFETQGISLSPGYGVYDYNGSDVITAKAQANYSTYGVLYNWYAVNQITLCPADWHVPSDGEWTSLSNYLSANEEYWCGGVSTQIAKSLASTFDWQINLNYCRIGNDQASNNRTGFNVLPGGARSNDGLFIHLNMTAYFWTSSSISWRRSLSSADSVLARQINGKSVAFSVRCLKN